MGNRIQSAVTSNFWTMLIPYYYHSGSVRASPGTRPEGVTPEINDRVFSLHISYRRDTRWQRRRVPRQGVCEGRCRRDLVMTRLAVAAYSCGDVIRDQLPIVVKSR